MEDLWYLMRARDGHQKGISSDCRSVDTQVSFCLLALQALVFLHLQNMNWNYSYLNQRPIPGTLQRRHIFMLISDYTLVIKQDGVSMDENSRPGWYNKIPFLIFHFFFFSEYPTALKHSCSLSDRSATLTVDNQDKILAPSLLGQGSSVHVLANLTCTTTTFFQHHLLIFSSSASASASISNYKPRVAQHCHCHCRTAWTWTWTPITLLHSGAEHLLTF